MSRGAVIGADPDANRSSSAGLDAATGVAFGLVASSNLVQGAWADTLPWLNLTTVGLVSAAIMTLLSLRHRVALSSVTALLMLLAAIALGFVQPALSGSAADKRTALLVSVIAVSVAGVVCMINSRRLRWFFGTIVLLAFVVLLAQIAVPDPVYLATGRRTPIGLNSIGAGRLLGAALVICVGIVLATRRRRRWLLVALGGALATGLVLAGSRGPLAGVAVALVVLVALQPTFSRRTKILVGLGFVASAAAGYRLLRSYGSRIVGGTDSGRSELYLDAIRIAEDHPLGIGWGNFFRHVQNSLTALQGDRLYAHNILLEFWIEAGVLGGLLFGGYILIVARQGVALRVSAAGRILSALAVSLFVGALFSSDIIGNRMMWVAFAAILGFAGAARPPVDGPASQRLARGRATSLRGQRTRRRPISTVR